MLEKRKEKNEEEGQLPLLLVLDRLLVESLHALDMKPGFFNRGLARTSHSHEKPDCVVGWRSDHAGYEWSYTRWWSMA